MITEDIGTGASFFARGGVVAFPTETVWGLGANALDSLACKKIYTIKGRPSDNPLIVHLGSVQEIGEWGEIDPSVLSQLHRWIPGPLTLILKKKRGDLFSCGLDTVALRVPSHPVAAALIGAAGVPICAPSANLSGKPSITRSADVIRTFQNRVDCIVLGEDPHHGIESTVLDLSKESPIYVRPGVVSFEELLPIFPALRRWDGGGPVVSPGIKYTHYAPEGRVFILSDLKKLPGHLMAGQIGFDLVQDAGLNHCVLDNVQYAKDLYAFFVECDKKNIEEIYCEIPREGTLYQAILYRLEKAAYR